MNADQLVSYSALTGIPLQLLRNADQEPSLLAEYQARQSASLTASLLDPRQYVRQRAAEGIAALATGTAPASLSPISYTKGVVLGAAPVATPSSGKAPSWVMAALIATAVLFAKRR